MALSQQDQTQRLIVAVPLTFFMGYMAWSGYTPPPEPELELNLDFYSMVLDVDLGIPEVEPVVISQLYTEQHVCLAKNIYHEARGEPEMGMLAVGYVTQNRAQDASFPDTLCGVVHDGPHGRYHDGTRQPYLNRCQFSWYCDGKSDRIGNLESWRAAWDMAAHVMQNPDDDPTGGALYYYNPETARRSALPWFESLVQTTVIGNHAFAVPAG